MRWILTTPDSASNDSGLLLKLDGQKYHEEQMPDSAASPCIPFLRSGSIKRSKFTDFYLKLLLFNTINKI